jgi:hypothetical protein
VVGVIWIKWPFSRSIGNGYYFVAFNWVLHFSLVTYFIINLVKFFCPLLHSFWLAYDLIEIWLNIKFYLFTLLKMMDWGGYHFCSGILVVTSPLNFSYQF